VLSIGHGSKNDQVDAVSVAVAALHAASLRTVDRLDRRIAALADLISAAVDESGSTLTELCGIGDLGAAELLRCVDRFPTAAHFASYAGVAPREVSSGDVVRHRLSRAGDRQINCVLHVMAITQIRYDTPGRAYYQRKRQAGKSHKEALGCLKRRLADVVYRQLLADRAASRTGPGGHSGATMQSSAVGPTPTAGSSDQSQPGPAADNPTTPQRRPS
jgi:transposase